MRGDPRYAMEAALTWRARVSMALLAFCALAFTARSEPRIPGLALGTLAPELRGEILIEDLNCVACHEVEGSLKTRSKQAPRLTDLGARLNPTWIERFIADPHGTQEGTTMPDTLASLEPAVRRKTARAITHFLLSTRTSGFAFTPPDAVASGHGQRLFLSRGCIACHSTPESDPTAPSAQGLIPLTGLESKYSFQSLSGFLHQPHRTRPSGRMPDLRLGHLDVERITHYLLKSTRVPGALAYTLYRGQVWEGLDSEDVVAERAGQVRDFALKSLGEVGHHTAIQYDGWIHIPGPGRYRFHLRMNGGSLVVDGRQLVRQDPSDTRGVLEWSPELDLEAGWRAIRLIYFHTGHDPAFLFEMEGPGFPRGPLPESLLSVSRDPIAALEPFQADSTLAAQGRDAFTKHRCARCHDDLEIRSEPAPAWSRLQPGKGCLSGGTGPWPRFHLDPNPRAEITLALSRAPEPERPDTQRLQKSLITFNCIACHTRTGVGGPSAERRGAFTGTEPGLGDAGRLPPSLDHVGAKLTSEGFRDVLLHGKRSRRYLDASMPQYGEAQVGHLVDLFPRVDHLEDSPIPTVTDDVAFRRIGHELVGSEGFSCIACHEFNGQKSGETGAIDLATVSHRLQKNWFHLYLRDPARFSPTVIMPAYWPNGRSGRTDLLDGDASLQIEALWMYLAEGERAKKPIGLSRQSRELRVGDVAELCRGQSPVGYRGIGVGYPERIHLAFDSGEMALRLLWKGEFVSIDAGHFHPRGTDPISFPPGIPFHRLEAPESAWPRKGKTNHRFPRDHGYRFLGYQLDAQRRPTLRYRYGDIEVEDFFEDRVDATSKPYFRRTLTFTTASPNPPFDFRAATGEELAADSDQRFQAGPLQVRIQSHHTGRIRTGRPHELLIRLDPPRGRSTLILDYQW